MSDKGYINDDKGRLDAEYVCHAEDIGIEECRCERCIDDLMAGVAAMGPEDFET